VGHANEFFAGNVGGGGNLIHAIHQIHSSSERMCPEYLQRSEVCKMQTDSKLTPCADAV
jgi:hypothetical protein